MTSQSYSEILLAANQLLNVKFDAGVHACAHWRDNPQNEMKTPLHDGGQCSSIVFLSAEQRGVHASTARRPGGVKVQIIRQYCVLLTVVLITHHGSVQRQLIWDNHLACGLSPLLMPRVLDLNVNACAFLGLTRPACTLGRAKAGIEIANDAINSTFRDCP